MTKAELYKFPLIMGIVNLTPDSFSDGGKINNTKSGVDYCLNLIDEGADILDLGGESTRPGSEPVSLESEIERVIPVIREVKKINPKIKISVDTTKYEVASQALDLGADYLNDISGLRFDDRLADLAAKFNIPLILMHSRKNPKTMQELPFYNYLFPELKNELQISVDIALSKGADKIIIDPGIGFAKNFEHNIEILKNLDDLMNLNYPILL
jgi:dihydropteroate synthase